MQLEIRVERLEARLAELEYELSKPKLTKEFPETLESLEPKILHYLHKHWMHAHKPMRARTLDLKFSHMLKPITGGRIDDWLMEVVNPPRELVVLFETARGSKYIMTKEDYDQATDDGTIDGSVTAGWGLK